MKSKAAYSKKSAARVTSQNMSAVNKLEFNNRLEQAIRRWKINKE